VRRWFPLLLLLGLNWLRANDGMMGFSLAIAAFNAMIAIFQKYIITENKEDAI
jgi:hypothetical protein